MNQASVWMLVAAALVGFSASWLVFEVRRAWSPEAMHVDHASVSTNEVEALAHLMPALVMQVTELRKEIAAVRAAELEAALRARLDLRSESAPPRSNVEAPTVETPRVDEPDAKESTIEAPHADDDWPGEGQLHDSRDLERTIIFPSIAAWGERS